MKKIILETIIVIGLIINLVFSLSWCYFLERNQILLQQQMEKLKELTYEHDLKQDKEIRLLQQDIEILEKGWN